MGGVGKSFCAGGDIMALYKSGMQPPGPGRETSISFPMYEYLLDWNIADMDICQIAIWNGIVMGGGVGLTSHAKIRIACETTIYAMPETGIGFFTDVG